MSERDANEVGAGHCRCCGCGGADRGGPERGDATRDEVRRHGASGSADAAREGHASGGGGVASFLGGDAGVAKALGAGALVAAGVMLFAANRAKVKPLVKGTVKEYFRFSDWLGAHFAEVKEDLSDMAAEARHEHEQEAAAHLELLDKERQLAQRLANMAKKRSEES